MTSISNYKRCSNLSYLYFCKSLFYLKCKFQRIVLLIFFTCGKYNKKSKTQFPVDFAQKIILEPKFQLQHRILTLMSNLKKSFLSEFSYDIKNLPPTLQLERIGLQCIHALKIKYRNET